MWSRGDFSRILGDRAVIGMVHLRPLPGAPLYGGSMAVVIDAAMADARAIAAGGADALMVENFGDRPFRRNAAGAETVSAMTAAIAAIRAEVPLPLGVNVLRNDGRSAMVIAAVTGASFIRVNVLVGAMLTDQGIVEGEADAVARQRAMLGAEVAIFGDYLVKHAVPLAAYDPLQLARDLRFRGLADAIVVSGRETGAAADPERVRFVRDAVDAPVVVGSGLSAENAREYAALADGAIVGSSIKQRGEVDAPVDRDRVAAIVERFKRG